MSPVDKRNYRMAALHKLAAKFAADQPRSSGHEYTATVSFHGTHISRVQAFRVPRDGSLMRRTPTLGRSHSIFIDCAYANGRVVLDWGKR
jgi:hypothetical protein